MQLTRKSVRSGTADERGTVLVWAITVVMMIGGVVMAGIDEVQAVDQLIHAKHENKGLADEVARAGIVDAYAWFRRQPTQPVVEFAPALDLAATTPVNETEDPARGLVRTYEITPGLWARYEVLKPSAQEDFTDANQNGHYDVGEGFVDANGDGRWNPVRHTQDTSSRRGLPGNGASWRIESRSTIFRRSRIDLPLGVGPNMAVSTETVAAEIRRLTIQPPATAAICCANGSDVSIGNRARVRGTGAAAVAYAESTGFPSTGGAEIDGVRTAVPNYAGDVKSIFGVDWTELRSMADISTTDGVTGVPAKLPPYSMTVVNSDITFDSTRPLRGTGLFVVQGNCTIDSGSNSFFNGVLYVQGKLTVRAPAFLRGTIIVQGDVDVRGTGGDLVEIEHDKTMLSSLAKRMGQYRYTKTPHVVNYRHPDGRPIEFGAKGVGDIIKGIQRTVPAAPAVPTVPSTPASTPSVPSAPASASAASTPSVPSTPSPEPLQTIYSPRGLIGAIEDFLASDPSADPSGLMLEALDKLRKADQNLAETPPKVKQSLAKVRQAVVKLTDALESGVDISLFADQLDGGSGTLFPQIREMVNTMIEDSTAPADLITEATTQYTKATAKMDRAKGRMNAGNTGGALTDYKSAAARFRNAVNEIDEYESWGL